MKGTCCSSSIIIENNEIYFLWRNLFLISGIKLVFHYFVLYILSYRCTWQVGRALKNLVCSLNNVFFFMLSQLPACIHSLMENQGPVAICLLGCPEKATERVIRNTCDAVILSTMHPRSAMTIVIQELHNDGSVSLNNICVL